MKSKLTCICEVSVNLNTKKHIFRNNRTSTIRWHHFHQYIYIYQRVTSAEILAKCKIQLLQTYLTGNIENSLLATIGQIYEKPWSLYQLLNETTLNYTDVLVQEILTLYFQKNHWNHMGLHVNLHNWHHYAL